MVQQSGSWRGNKGMEKQVGLQDSSLAFPLMELSHKLIMKLIVILSIDKPLDKTHSLGKISNLSFLLNLMSSPFLFSLLQSHHQLPTSISSSVDSIHSLLLTRRSNSTLSNSPQDHGRPIPIRLRQISRRRKRS